MLELTSANAVDYARQRSWIGPGPAHADVLSGGVSNQVIRITTPQRRLVVKQSRPQLRTRDAWFSDLERIYREQEVMQALHPFLPDVVPAVLFVDRDDFIYAMSHAPGDVVWKAELLAGRIDPGFGRQVGRVLGRMHQMSAEGGFQQFSDHNVYVQLRVDPFYRRIQERCPDVADIVGAIVQDMLTVKEALCHGDYTPKNMLIHDGGFTLVDYETAHFGDPTMDLGLFLTHLTLKTVRSPERCADFVALMKEFWQGYRASVTFRGAAELERRGLAHLGVCLLARIDGTSPVDYLPEEPKRQFVRRLGRMILREECTTWEAVWRRCDDFGSAAQAQG